ncbi:MAG: GeoRSP system radical SAM/SPASM protein [Nitrospirae bacterium]|nr:GeoRSP system radical SAM/SPASM protein [Nitrospirota bacterium]
MSENRIPSAPITINWTLTFRCNFDCRHCYSRVEKAEELETEQVKDIMRKVAKYKVPFINFGGGEPLLRKDLFELTAYATSLGFNVSMNTNGYLMDKAAAKKAAESGFKTVGISIDSTDPAVHDEFRNIKGSHAKAIAAAKYLREEGVRLTISSVICRINYHDFPGLVQQAKDLGAEQIALHNYKCTGRGMANKDELDLDPSEWMDFYMKAIELRANEKDIRISLDDPITASIHKSPEKTIVKGSTCGKLSLNIRANGDVTPCGFIPVSIGNLLTDDLKDLWDHSKVLEKMRNKKPKEKCLTCKHYDDCLGGCSARAYATTGDFNSPDPHCWVGKE